MASIKGLILKISAIVVFGLFSLQANASVVFTFSDLSSDPTPASVLDGTLTLDITSFASDTGNDLLTITLDNTSDYDINSIFINFDGVNSGFVLESGPGAIVLGPAIATKADGFGEFDMRLFGFDVMASDTGMWTIDLGVTGVTDSDFLKFSSPPPSENLALAAMKFVSGPGDDSAFGAVVPVPAAVWLFGSGLLGLVGVARRKRA